MTRKMSPHPTGLDQNTSDAVKKYLFNISAGQQIRLRYMRPLNLFDIFCRVNRPSCVTSSHTVLRWAGSYFLSSLPFSSQSLSIEMSRSVYLPDLVKQNYCQFVGVIGPKKTPESNGKKTTNSTELIQQRQFTILGGRESLEMPEVSLPQCTEG